MRRLPPTAHLPPRRRATAEVSSTAQPEMRLPGRNVDTDVALRVHTIIRRMSAWPGVLVTARKMFMCLPLQAAAPQGARFPLPFGARYPNKMPET